MNLLDMQTVMFSYMISSFICMVVMASLWFQYRRRSPELGFWLADFVLQFTGLLLTGVLRPYLPNYISMVLANTLILGGTLVLFIGMERYLGKTGAQWYGMGYPRGLKGTQIPMVARIFAVVDVWDALTSDRPYRKAWPEEKTRQHIQAGGGTHFDPQVVIKFF